MVIKIGQRFGSLIVKEKLPSKGHNSCWLCECNCGNISTVLGWNLIRGATKHCQKCGHKEISKKKKLQLVGQKFGSLLVIKDVTQPGDRRTSWKCRCDCGNEYEVSGSHLTSGHTTRCRECSYKSAGNKRKGGELSTGTWNGILLGAKTRNIDVRITRQQALELFISQERKCALSGVDLKLHREKNEDRTCVTASLDRIDSDLPYTKDNVQWVHKSLNLMKNHFPQDVFLEWCRKVVDHKRRSADVIGAT